jgi:hypothetical protein
VNIYPVAPHVVVTDPASVDQTAASGVFSIRFYLPLLDIGFREDDF